MSRMQNFSVSRMNQVRRNRDVASRRKSNCWNQVEADCDRVMIQEDKLGTIPALTGTLLTVEGVARLLQVPTSWVYERTRQRGINRLPGFRLGKYWRFREADVMVWLERQRSEGS
jgi:excisionase family DNA binding protein